MDEPRKGLSAIEIKKLQAEPDVDELPARIDVIEWNRLQCRKLEFPPFVKDNKKL